VFDLSAQCHLFVEQCIARRAVGGALARELQVLRRVRGVLDLLSHCEHPSMENSVAASQAMTMSMGPSPVTW
jgi:hypothetical protein